MEEVNVNVLVDAKKEYTSQLINLLTPSFYRGFSHIYQEACSNKSVNKTIFREFQDSLEYIARGNWNQHKVEEETEKVIQHSGCDWLDELLGAIFVSNIRILLSVRPRRNQQSIDIEIPKKDYFIHTCYQEIAKNFWQNPYLFDQEVNIIQQQENMRSSISLIETSIEKAIRRLLPFKNILDKYINNQPILETPTQDLADEITDLESRLASCLEKFESRFSKQVNYNDEQEESDDEQEESEYEQEESDDEPVESDDEPVESDNEPVEEEHNSTIQEEPVEEEHHSTEYHSTIQEEPVEEEHHSTIQEEPVEEEHHLTEYQPTIEEEIEEEYQQIEEEIEELQRFNQPETEPEPEIKTVRLDTYVKETKPREFSVNKLDSIDEATDETETQKTESVEEETSYPNNNQVNIESIPSKRFELRPREEFVLRPKTKIFKKKRRLRDLNKPSLFPDARDK